MRSDKSFLISLFIFSVGFGSAAQAADEDDVCKILARNLKPDVVTQALSIQQYSAMKNVVGEKRYDVWKSASSSSVNGSFSIPMEVDAALGGSSNQQNWRDRREQYLKLSYQEYRLSYSSNAQRSTTNAAIIKELASCGEEIARTTNRPVYALLDSVTKNRDGLSVLLSFKTQGEPHFVLTSFRADPPDPNFKCADDVQDASDQNRIDLKATTKRIGCSKSPNSELVLSISTEQGAAPDAIMVESKDDAVKKNQEAILASFESVQRQLAELRGKIDQEQQDVHVTFVAPHQECPAGWRNYGDIQFTLDDAFHGENPYIVFEKAIPFIQPPGDKQAGKWWWVQSQLCYRK
jgi:hypothetical protein